MPDVPFSTLVSMARGNPTYGTPTNSTYYGLNADQFRNIPVGNFDWSRTLPNPPAPRQWPLPSGVGVGMGNNSLVPSGPVYDPNPAILKAIQTLMGQGTGLLESPVQSGLTNIIRNPNQAGRINASNALYSSPAVAGAKAQSLTDYTREALAQRPSAQADLAQETAAVGRTYDPNGLQLDLSRNALNRSAALRDAGEQAIRRAGRDNNIARMMTGNSSYLDRAYGDALTRILSENAIKNSDLNRENLLYLQGQRTGLLGTRGKLRDQYLASGIMPYETVNRLQSQDLGNIGTIGNMEAANTYSNYVSPEEALNQRIGLLGNLDQMAARYYQ